MLDFRQSLINSTLRKVLKRLHYPLEVMLMYTEKTRAKRKYEVDNGNTL